MKVMRYLGVLLIGCGLLISCGGDDADGNVDFETTVPDSDFDTTVFLESLAALETRIDSDIEMPKEKDLKEAMNKFLKYVDLFPEDEESANYLLRASDISLTLDRPKKSVRLLERIITEYPAYDRMEDVKYNRASHLDFELRDTTAAKVAYQEFMTEYPDSPLIDGCKSRIENIQYSLEELADKFIKDLEANGLNN